MRPVLRNIWRLARLCIIGQGGAVGLIYFFLIFGLGLASVRVSILMIAWNADFYNALQKLDVPAALEQIRLFFILTAITASLHLASGYLRRLLQIRWRHALTEAMLDRWLAHKAFWHLRDRADAGLDNPDQRIAEDCRIFVEKLTEEALELLTKIVALVSYVAILWSLSTFALALVLAGVPVEIPRYMVWAAPVYVAVATLVTHWLGAPLKKIDFERQRREADFRFALARLRDNVEAVALAGGERAERGLLATRFAAIRANWRALNNRELILGLFSRPYMQTVLTIPTFIALPAYLAGRVTFGGLMQIRSAFQNVVTTLSWFIFSYKDLALLAATASRLGHFLVAAEEIAGAPARPRLAASPDRHFRARGIALRTPAGRALAPLPELTFCPGEAYWLVAPSGHGKSSFVKALAGLWRDGEGEIERPEGSVFFASQHLYLPLGSLAAALAYPAVPEAFGAADYRRALARVGLGGLWDETGRSWTDIRQSLSGGERQRLVLARIVLQRPDWVVLDEATGALDVEAERQVLAALREALPAAGLIVIAHRPPQGLGACHTVRLVPDGDASQADMPRDAILV